MSDAIDRAQERDVEILHDALQAQQRRAGLNGLCAEASATHCRICDERIPVARRRAVPGVQTCVACQQELERCLARA